MVAGSQAKEKGTRGELQTRLASPLTGPSSRMRCSDLAQSPKGVALEFIPRIYRVSYHNHLQSSILFV